MIINFDIFDSFHKLFFGKLLFKYWILSDNHMKFHQNFWVNYYLISSLHQNTLRLSKCIKLKYQFSGQLNWIWKLVQINIFFAYVDFQDSWLFQILVLQFGINEHSPILFWKFGGLAHQLSQIHERVNLHSHPRN